MGETAVSLTFATYTEPEAPWPIFFCFEYDKLGSSFDTASLSFAMTSFSDMVDMRTSCLRSGGGLEVSAASAALTGSACPAVFGPTFRGLTGAGKREGGWAWA